MMEPCYQAYTDDYYNIDPDDPIVFDPDLGLTHILLLLGNAL